MEERQRRDREGSTGRGRGRKAMRRRRVYKEWRGVELGRGVRRPGNKMRGGVGGRRGESQWEGTGVHSRAV